MPGAWGRVLAAGLLLSAAAGCVGADAAEGQRRPADASCPVTMPMDVARLPPVLARSGDDVWYGEGGLWVGLSWVGAPGAAAPVRPDGGGLKYPSVTLRDGRHTEALGPPTVRARRLDAPGTARVSFGGYADGGIDSIPRYWWPTGIDFPDSGCWLVTEALGDDVVRFVVRVEETT
ncbi:MAG: hypothetical protein GEV03_09310 [Streptosporangiales bacterium]|nr:hypothetical protein [Streptosporangiales bacterium]